MAKKFESEKCNCGIRKMKVSEEVEKVRATNRIKQKKSRDARAKKLMEISGKLAEAKEELDFKTEMFNNLEARALWDRHQAELTLQREKAISCSW